MQKLRRWIFISGGLVLLGLTISAPLSPYASRSIQHSWQLGHVLLFAVWTCLLHPLFNGIFPRPLARVIAISTAALAGGLAIETTQSFVGRFFSLKDLAFDMGGCLLALCYLAWSGSLQIRKASSIFFNGAALFFAIYAVTPLIFALVDEFNMRKQFPRLADFDSVLELGRWRGNIDIVSLPSLGGDEKVLRAQLSTANYSGFSLKFFPRNWRNYQQLRFELFNPATSLLKLTIRIHDDKHYSLGGGDYYDRFNRELRITPGWNSIVLELEEIAAAPRNRPLDLGNLQGLGLFSRNLPGPRYIYLDKMRISN